MTMDDEKRYFAYEDCGDGSQSVYMAENKGPLKFVTNIEAGMANKETLPYLFKECDNMIKESIGIEKEHFTYKEGENGKLEIFNKDSGELIVKVNPEDYCLEEILTMFVNECSNIIEKHRSSGP